MTTTKSFDNLNRLTYLGTTPASGVRSGAPPLPSFAYQYNPANQRTRSSLADNSYWRYEYDSLGQVKSGKKYWSDQTPVAGQQFEYAFDDIGNRTQTKAGGDAVGSSLRLANYSANALNEYTSRDVPGYANVLGLELATNTVTVNGQAPYRKGEFFQKELIAANSSAPVWQSVTVAAPNEAAVNGNVFVAQTQEQFSNDRGKRLV